MGQIGGPGLMLFFEALDTFVDYFLYLGILSLIAVCYNIGWLTDEHVTSGLDAAVSSATDVANQLGNAAGAGDIVAGNITGLAPSSAGLSVVNVSLEVSTMYETEEAYKTVPRGFPYIEIAETSLGNIYAEHDAITDGTSTALWVNSIIDAISTILMLFACSKAKKRMAKMTADTDRVCVTMSDYSLHIKPAGWRWAAGGCCAANGAAEGKWWFGTR
eukprot:SAG11_NODE_3255_length_2576_cov_1.721437_2_plen_217_part_00